MIMTTMARQWTSATQKKLAARQHLSSNPAAIYTITLTTLTFWSVSDLILEENQNHSIPTFLVYNI